LFDAFAIEGGFMKRFVSTVLFVFIAAGSLTVRAQERGAPAVPATHVAIASRPDRTALGAAAIKEHFDRWIHTEAASRSESLPRRQEHRMGTGTRALIIAGSAVAGFFAGGTLGHKIENTFAPCGCDDPGLKGALIGAPIGAIAGGVVAAILTR
jgi:hypothetical protein